MPQLENLWQVFVPNPWWDEAALIVDNIHHETPKTQTTIVLSDKGNRHGNIIGKLGEIACTHMLNALRIEHVSLAWEIKTSRVKSDFSDVILSGQRGDVITGETTSEKLAKSYALLIPKHKRQFPLYFSMAYASDLNKVYFMGWLPGDEAWGKYPITRCAASGGPHWLKYDARVIPAENLLSRDDLTHAPFVRGWKTVSAPMELEPKGSSTEVPKVLHVRTSEGPSNGR